jgi:hypothetical protein
MELENGVGQNGYGGDKSSAKFSSEQNEASHLTVQDKAGAGQDAVVYIEGPRFWLISAA